MYEFVIKSPLSCEIYDDDCVEKGTESDILDFQIVAAALIIYPQYWAFIRYWHRLPHK